MLYTSCNFLTQISSQLSEIKNCIYYSHLATKFHFVTDLTCTDLSITFNRTITRGSHFHETCRTIHNRNQDFWLMKIYLDHLIALKKGPWLLDILAKALQMFALLNCELFHLLWSTPWLLDSAQINILIPVMDGSTGLMGVTIPCGEDNCSFAPATCISWQYWSIGLFNEGNSQMCTLCMVRLCCILD